MLDSLPGYIQEIIAEVARHYDLEPSDVFNCSTKRKHAHARAEVWSVLRDRGNAPADIARMFSYSADTVREQSYYGAYLQRSRAERLKREADSEPKPKSRYAIHHVRHARKPCSLDKRE
jgi:hypothetical protein